MDDKQLALLIGAINALTTEVKHAVELMVARDDDDDQVLTFTMREYDGYDWSTIGAKVISYEDPERRFATVVAGADGKIYKRRSKDTYGSEIWFARANGKKPDGTNLYKWLLKFIEEKSQIVEPLGRKAETALKAAQSAPAAPQSPAPAAAKPTPTHTVNGPMKLADAIPPAPPVATPAPAPAPETPPDLFAQWQAAHDAATATGAAIPPHLMLETDDNAAILQNKINGLNRLAAGDLFDMPAPPVQHHPQRVAGSPVNTDPFRGNVAALDPLEVIRTIIGDKAGRYQRATPPRSASIKQAGEVEAALRAHMGEDGPARFARTLFGKSLSGSQTLAAHDWLRPARNANGMFAASAEARQALKTLFAEKEIA